MRSFRYVSQPVGCLGSRAFFGKAPGKAIEKSPEDPTAQGGANKVGHLLKSREI